MTYLEGRGGKGRAEKLEVCHFATEAQLSRSPGAFSGSPSGASAQGSGRAAARLRAFARERLRAGGLGVGGLVLTVESAEEKKKNPPPYIGAGDTHTHTHTHARAHTRTHTHTHSAPARLAQGAGLREPGLPLTPGLPGAEPASPQEPRSHTNPLPTARWLGGPCRDGLPELLKIIIYVFFFFLIQSVQIVQLAHFLTIWGKESDAPHPLFCFTF